MAVNVVLPTIIVEAAFTKGQPVAGAGAITLNDATFGLLDTDFLNSADVWTDITAFVRGFTITRSSTRLQGPLLQFEPGTATVILNNSDGRFDPLNQSGPYWLNGQSQVRGMVPIRISATWNNVYYPLFRGFADSWQEPSVEFAGAVTDWTLTATDCFKVLDGITLPPVTAVGASEFTGARIHRILDAAGWYSGAGPGARSIAAGDSQLQATTFDDTAMNLMQLAADSEIGQLYVDGSGAVVFRNRNALITETRSVVPQAVFGDNPGNAYDIVYGNVYLYELACATISRSCDDTTIGNDIQATRVGGTLQEVKDAASIARFLFPRTYTRSDLILLSDLDAHNWAGWVLYVSLDCEDRVSEFTVNPQDDPNNLWPQVLGRQMMDRVTVNRRPPNAGLISNDGFISGIVHNYDVASSQWTTTFGCQDAERYGSFFTLDGAIAGQLDHNAIAY